MERPKYEEFNTREENVELIVPTIELLAYSQDAQPLLASALGTGNAQCSASETVNANSRIAKSVKTIIGENRYEKVIKLLRLEHLNKEEKESVVNLIKENQDRFHLSGEFLGATTAIEHGIATTDEIPVNARQYRFPPVHKAEINIQVNELLGNNIIEHSSSPYNFPVWIVPKKADSKGIKQWRMVIDYRRLNEKTIGDAYPLPNITEILDQLGSAKYFSVFDLASGFHQINVKREDAHTTAFSTPHGHWQFNRMSFGLKNAPVTFQRLMDQVLL